MTEAAAAEAMCGPGPVPFYEVTPRQVRRYQTIAAQAGAEMPEWAVVLAGSVVFALAGLLSGAWLHI
ncbi:MAG: hypothetical protein JSR45_04470 [Proteobacteria bacterium]|nr:hypothetical protein [Pseudomonadota bacterium]